MALAEFTRRLVETRLAAYCARRVPAVLRDQVGLLFRVAGNRVTLLETRPAPGERSSWGETPLAQFRFDSRTSRWSLYCMDRWSRWHLYDLVQPSADIDDLLQALDEDRLGIFWD